MAVNYDLYTIPHPDSEKEEEITYVRISKASTLTTAELAAEIEFGGSQTAGDITGAIAQITDLMAKHLAKGQRIHIEGLGYFQLSITTLPDKKDKKIRSDYVRVRGINFLPEKKLMNKLHNVEFIQRPFNIHSRRLTEEEVLDILEKHFEKRPFITRAEFQKLCVVTKNVALKWINKLIADGVLIKSGYFNSSVYEWKGKEEGDF